MSVYEKGNKRKEVDGNLGKTGCSLFGLRGFCKQNKVAILAPNAFLVETKQIANNVTSGEN